MAEYIEREEMREVLKKYSISTWFADIPKTADVRPERHGEWFGTVCSMCGGSTSWYYDCDYCPQCGAKMDGKDGN